MVEKKEISPLATDIIPGKECAVLEMADGRKVELGLGKNLGQLQLEGTVVTNDSNRLAYKQNTRVTHLHWNITPLLSPGEANIN